MEDLRMATDYDSAAKTQEVTSEPLADYLRAALADFSQCDSLTIADYGCATGLNSCKTLKPVLSDFRARSAAKVLVFHDDLPSNDWSALFTTLDSAAHTYRSVPDVYSFAVGSSFFKLCFPADFVDIGYSAISFHWLSRPSQGRNQLYRFLGRTDFESEVHELISKDFGTILRQRYAELKPGGHLIFNFPDRIPAGKKLILAPLVEVAYEMQRKGDLSAEYLESFPLPFAANTLEANLQTIASETPGFTVIANEVRLQETPLYQAFTRDGNVETYAKNFSEFCKGFLLHYLKGTCKGGPQGDELIRRFFENLESHVRGHPEALYQSFCSYHLQKRSSH